MEESQDKRSRPQVFYENAKNSLFSVSHVLLKDKTTGQWFACFLMTVMMFQILTFLFEKKVLLTQFLARI